jgi:hypothetical protein
MLFWPYNLEVNYGFDISVDSNKKMITEKLIKAVHTIIFALRNKVKAEKAARSQYYENLHKEDECEEDKKRKKNQNKLNELKKNGDSTRHLKQQFSSES